MMIADNIIDNDDISTLPVEHGIMTASVAAENKNEHVYYTEIFNYLVHKAFPQGSTEGMKKIIKKRAINYQVCLTHMVPNWSGNKLSSYKNKKRLSN